MNIEDLMYAVVLAAHDACGMDGGRIATPEDGLEIMAAVARTVHNFDYYIDNSPIEGTR